MAYFLLQTKNEPEQSGLCSDVVEARRIELLSESASGRFSTGVVYCFDSTSDGAIDKPVRVITGIVPRSAPGGHGSFF